MEPVAVIIDGRTCKACVPDTDLVGWQKYHYSRRSDRVEEKVYVCIRKGLVLYSAALHSWHGNVHGKSSSLDVNKEPTDEEIKYALE